jgi:flagella basal body P-ring formation protein FlgA
MAYTVAYRSRKLLVLVLILAGSTLFYQEATAAVRSDSLVKARLQRLIEQHLLSYYPKDQYRFELEFKRLPRTLEHLEPQYLASAKKTSRGRPRGYETMNIALVDDQGESNGLTHVQVHIRLWQKLPIPRQRILSGERLSQDLLNYKWVEITRMTGNFITEAPRVDGYIADHMLPAERPLRETDLARPSVVEAGDMVNMQFNDSGLQISLRCTARQSAAKGEEIRVYSEQTRRTYQVKVLNRSQVQWLQTL